ncbi:glycosyltransferase family 4 protein [Thermoanaerobacterium thermosaccharolyticum]|uniref:glycosyltransferase family 4 protein n=1 Tax=Thermoanaerobacterium thermosaccharolyticum TaxID=1517 RepID=UPI00123C5679|nr:glycosyltransferase family 4 protein [Thermoanaerobacterium thermosaccharolyticum]KAA5806377.1 glycosyltransferase family 4 protein [Thermoanaerobacterium thermosaccharolyticum]
MKIAIVHDWLTNMGGAERVILAFHEIFPDAPIYTTVFNPDRLPDEFKKIDVRTSFIQRLPKAKTKYNMYLPFMPTAFEQFDLSEYDIVLSSSSSCAKGVLTRPDTLHICYCHTPMRYAWDFYSEYKESAPKWQKKFIPFLMNYIRMWDRLSADRVDYFIANSNEVAKRIKKHYRRESVVINPPVNTDFYTLVDEDEDYFLIVSRLVEYKRIDIAVEAFNELGYKLIIIGDGPEKEKLESKAKANIEFLGRLPDEEVREYYAKCKAFIFPGEEDFGITPLEAQASGRPVIAYGRGGVLDSVVDGVTGVFFDKQNKESLKEAIVKFKDMKFDKNLIRKHAEEFDINIFKKKVYDFVIEKYREFKGN